MQNNRYIRQKQIMGEEGQELLQNINLLCIGAGGLGTLASSFLVAAGIGRITLIDEDNIEISNLTRQITYNETNCGQPKVKVLENYLHALNSKCQISKQITSLNYNNADVLIKQHDVVVDCTDNFKSKYLISDSCNLNNKPLVTASVDGFNGQVMVLLGELCYRCIFPDAKNHNSCSEGSVIGPSVGVVATYQANEALKLITKINTKSSLIQIDCLNNITKSYNIKSDMDCQNKHIIQYDDYERHVSFLPWFMVLKLHLEKNLNLIDIREKSADNLPVTALKFNSKNITSMDLPYNDKLVIICNNGHKSKLAALKLVSLGYQEVYYTSLLGS